MQIWILIRKKTEVHFWHLCYYRLQLLVEIWTLKLDHTFEIPKIETSTYMALKCTLPKSLVCSHPMRQSSYPHLQKRKMYVTLLRLKWGDSCNAVSKVCVKGTPRTYNFNNVRSFEFKQVEKIICETSRQHVRRDSDDRNSQHKIPLQTFQSSEQIANIDNKMTEDRGSFQITVIQKPKNSLTLPNNAAN